MKILEEFVVNGFESFKNLSKLTRGLETTRQNPRNNGILQPTKKKIDNKDLVANANSWVHVCLSKIGDRVGEVPLRLYARLPEGRMPREEAMFRRLGKLEHKNLGKRVIKQTSNSMILADDIAVEIVDHPFLTLINNPSGFRVMLELMSTTAQFLKLTGDAYWYVPKSRSGIPDAIYLLPSQYVEVIPGKGNRWVRTYLFGDGPVNERVPFSEDEIVHFRRPNLANEYVGMGDLQPMFRAKKLNDEMQNYNLSLNKNSAAPSHVITFKDSNTPKEKVEKFKRAFDRILQGVSKAGNSFVHNGEADITQVGLAPKDMVYIGGQNLTRDMILNSFGVPKSIIEVDNVNRANADAGHYDFEKNTIKVLLNYIAQVINAKIIPSYGENALFVSFDENVPEDETFELDKTTRLVSTGIISIEEGREREGYGEINPDDTFVLQGGTAISEAGENNDPNEPNTETEEEESLNED